MSFHELVASYPWTGKRLVRVLDRTPEIPRRNPLAYLLAIFVPYAGRMGAGFGVLIYVYFVGIIAAIAIPAYQNYTVRACSPSPPPNPSRRDSSSPITTTPRRRFLKP